jgi:radical SAM superfamily enzyme YgiQ (UPF0313 family)
VKYDIIFFTDLDTRFWHSKTLGPYRLATELRNRGYTVKVVDFFGQWVKSPHDFFQLLSYIVGDNTKFIGFSGTFFSKENTTGIKNYNDFKDHATLSLWPIDPVKMSAILDNIRLTYPGVKLVYGGASAEYRVNALKNLMDYIVVGLADTTIIELAGHLSNNTPIKFMPTGSRARVINHDTAARSFDFAHSITRYRPEDHIMPGEIMPFETSRGCLFKCSFCSYPLIGRKKGDPEYHKKVQTMAEEFRHNYENYGVYRYMFVDDTFNETTKKLEDVLEARNLSGVDIRFSCYLRADLVMRFPEQLQLLKELGVETAFLGIESLHQPSAQSIGKSTDPEKIKDITYQMKSVWGEHVKIKGSFIVGLPEDTPENLASWVSWVCDSNSPIDFPNFNPLNIYSGTTSEIAQNPEKFGYTLYADRPGYWTNQHWDYTQARDYSRAIMQDLWTKQRIRIAGWDIIGFQNYGYTIEELGQLSYDQLDFETLLKKKADQWHHYKNTILEYEKL